MFNLELVTKKHGLKANLAKGSKIIKDIISPKNPKEIIVKSTSIYRNDGKTVEKLIETDDNTGNTLKITYFDYFDDKKIKLIEDYEDGIKIKVTTFSFFKSVTDIDKNTGKKLKTTNYNLKNNNKMSRYDYDIETEKIIRITVFQADGENVSFIKEISPQTGIISRCISYKKNSGAISSVSKFDTVGDTTIKTTYYYSTPVYLTAPEMIDKKITSDSLNKKVLDTFNSNKFNHLLDNLYKNKQSVAAINVS